MTKLTDQDYYNYRRSIKRLLVLAGLWPNKTRHPYLSKFLFSFGFLVSSTMTIGALNFCVQAPTLNMFTWGLASLLGIFVVPARMVLLTYQRKNLKKVNDGMTADFHENLKNKENWPALLEHLAIFHRIFRIYNYGILMVDFTGFVRSLLFAFRGVYTRMYTIAVPYDYKSGGWTHWGTFIFEIIFAFYIWVVALGVDMSLGYYALQYVGEHKIQTGRYHNLKPDQDYRKELKKVVDKDNDLKDAHNLLQEVYSLQIMWIAISSAIALCMVTYQVSHMKEFDSVRVSYLVSWLVVKITQIFSYAMIGDLMTDSTEECINAIYDASWTDHGDIGFRKDMMIVLLQKPLLFQANGLITLDFKMFAAVLNTTYSYYTLLVALE